MIKSLPQSLHISFLNKLLKSRLLLIEPPFQLFNRCLRFSVLRLFNNRRSNGLDELIALFEGLNGFKLFIMIILYHHELSNLKQKKQEP